MGGQSAHKPAPGALLAFPLSIRCSPHSNVFAMNFFVMLFPQLASGACNLSAQTQASTFGAFDLIAALLLSRQQEIVQWACRCLAALVKGSANVRPSFLICHSLCLLDMYPGARYCSVLGGTALACAL